MGLIKQLNQEYQSKFISIREAFEAIKEVSPASTEAEIAKLLIRALFSDEHNKNEAEIQPFTGVITSIDASSSQTLELEGLLKIISTEKVSIAELNNLWFDKLESFGVREFFYTGQADNLGWYREGFNEALKKNGLDIEAIQQQKSKEPPAWFKPKHLMPYLSLNEAAFTIAFCEEFPNHREFSRDDLDSRFLCDIGVQTYKELLRQKVKTGCISLSPSYGSRTDPESQWQLDVLDIRQYCHQEGLKWPMPWEETVLIINDPNEFIDWPLSIEQIPAWLKPYMARAYLSLEEASDIITRVEFCDDQDGFNRAYPAYKEMLRRNVMEGLIRLSPNAGNVTDYEEYWQLDVNDIGKLCSTINILWPISYVKNEANTNSNQTVVNDPELNARLEELKAANEALKAENEALKKRLSEACNSDTLGLEFLHITDHLKLVAKTQKDFYSKPDSRPKVDTVIEDMMENYKLSKNDSIAIERVARPR
ncbi:hypothetical protein CEQ07_01195 [Oligella urethralis]|uniref:hypothetical protein n=1 Tax=Oligella urethralis TaxID=90245 RepID=UPI000CFEFE7B|nr:hypothetical protein [Oligella urethralis]AVL70186.1 hypothetical protein CEQ07_01195 [Oligella urethralis]